MKALTKDSTLQPGIISESKLDILMEDLTVNMTTFLNYKWIEE